MKKNRFFMMAFAAILIVGAVSCGKDDDSNNNGGGDTPQPVDDWVDLGLPSGLLWARCNLGANTPEELGNYYAWGETMPKEIYNDCTYRYCTANGTQTIWTKYNPSSDTLTTLEAIDDAATAALGNDTRTPTKADWQELIDNTTFELATENNVDGWRLTSIVNGNTLFLPANGYLSGEDTHFFGENGGYWSSSLHVEHPGYAWYLCFKRNTQEQHIYSQNRYFGLMVRAVRQK